MITRRAALLLALAVAACSSSAPRVFEPLRYDYLPAIQLNVATVDIDDHWHPLTLADVGRQSPAQPGPTLAQMGRDRLRPVGANGHAVFTVDDASMIQNGDTVTAHFSVRVDIVAEDGVRLGYAEARVSRTRSGVARGGEERAGQLYDLTKQMMDMINVELEFQVRRNLGNYVTSSAPAPAGPAPVTQESLPAPTRH